MLYRLVFVSDLVGPARQSRQAQAEIVGQAIGTNRRDEVSGAMLFHAGQVLQLVEGARVDLDRLMRRLEADGRHADLRILADRPVMHRRATEPMRMCRATPDQVEAILGGRDMAELEVSVLERLLCGDVRDNIAA